MLKIWKWVVLATLIGLASPAIAQVDIEPYLKRDGFGAIKISPDGQYYAATLPMEDRTGLVILRRADKKVMTRAIGPKGSEIDDFWWANDERVLLAMAERLGSRDEPYATGELLAVNLDGEPVMRLVGLDDNPGIGYTMGDKREYATLVDTLPAEPSNVLIAVSDFSANPQTRVEKLDVYTARRKVVAIAPVRRARFVTDKAGEVRFAEGAGDDNLFKTYYRDNASSDWRLINDEATSGHYERPWGFAADGVTAYLRVGQAAGPDSIVALDTRTGARKEVQRDDVVDPYTAVLDTDDHSLAAIQYVLGGIRTRFFDENTARARIFRKLEKAFPDSGIWVTSQTRDGHLLLVQVFNERTFGDYYLYDTEAKTAFGVFAQREWLDPAKMSASRPVTVKARDGLVLHGSLTVPRGGASQSLPMVVMPHGGPIGVFDKWKFDEDTQLLVDAGYAVLRIDYRGSGHYGHAFRQAGAREWGGRMQDDVTDATQWAIDQKIADPKRICIYGADYGGYAALMGVAREPDLYRCAVGYVGAYDLEALHRDDSKLARWTHNWANDWIGNRDDLAARSPTTLANRIKVPVFLAAGGEDKRAPIAHSKKMERALRAANVPVETLYFPTEGHGFYTEPHRREFYTRLLDFLARSIGGATAKTSQGKPRTTE